jgi:transposase
MWRTLGISESDWQQTPPAVQTKLRSQYHETHSLKLRSVSAKKQIADLSEPTVHIQRLNQRIASQQKQIIRLQKQLTETARQSIEITRLKAEIAVLKEKLGQNSRNSSLPPSSDSPFGKPPIVRSEPSGLKAGAQRGHGGVGRNLKSIDQVDCVVDLLRPSACSSCGSLLLGADESPARRQLVEITAAGTLLTEYRRHVLRCLYCRKINRAEWSEKAKRGAFGAKVVAVIGYLTGRLGISHRDAAETMHELFAVRISLGSISAAQKRLSQTLVAPVAALHEFVEQQSVCLVDETSWREKQMKPWLWVKATARATVFRILPGRSRLDAKTMIGRNENSFITSDRYPGYNHLTDANRQICWAQQRLDFQKLIEPVKAKLSELLFTGTQSANSKTRNTCSGILKLELSLWTFARVEGLEPTNNQAERALRRAVMWRRKSFGTHSETGSRFVERMLTVVTTLGQQGRSVLDYLYQTGQKSQMIQSVTGLTHV